METTTQWKMGEKSREEDPQEQTAEYLGIVSAIQSLQFRLTPVQLSRLPFYDCFALLDINPSESTSERSPITSWDRGSFFLARIFPANGDHLWEPGSPRNSLMGTTSHIRCKPQTIPIQTSRWSSWAHRVPVAAAHRPQLVLPFLSFLRRRFQAPRYVGGEHTDLCLERGRRFLFRFIDQQHVSFIKPASYVVIASPPWNFSSIVFHRHFILQSDKACAVSPDQQG
ncbi:hypothetical protein ASPBRDRAFT_278384 [Aspergillus brasiliensis CBS 101740]|uniref:Uncharacterized protein n=1 Tax=Aspergillus brasiliensis (strain CBS 101740 / IMI 381727 / IBT 21946) TaxID=767769 RepID=A0A1L9UCN2_ASPBC|nr:hypothetical protein ASPBRDRAFT_278384 [Aspergillus brasiliensis CBS 101740]